ncbi:hypothetical protein Tco_0962220 [Tanacetum coccineum]
MPRSGLLYPPLSGLIIKPDSGLITWLNENVPAPAPQDLMYGYYNLMQGCLLDKSNLSWIFQKEAKGTHSLSSLWYSAKHKPSLKLHRLSFCSSLLHSSVLDIPYYRRQRLDVLPFSFGWKTWLHIERKLSSLYSILLSQLLL